jgi:beta-lactamase class A
MSDLEGDVNTGSRWENLRSGRKPGIALISLLIVVAGVAIAVGASHHGGSSEKPEAARRASANSAHKRTGRTTETSSTSGPAPTSAPDPSPFGNSVTAYLAGRTGTLTAALYDLSTGQTYAFHPGIAQDEASVVKVDIMATLLSQQVDGSPPTSPSEQSLLTSMIEESDNDSATALWNEAGGPIVINAFNQQVGMSSTTPSQCVTCPNFPWPGWGLTTTTADDQVALLRQFVLPSRLLSASQQQYGLNLMKNITSSESWGVTGGVPSGVRVALKNGWLPLTGETDWQVNSIGWIDGAGRDYILAVLTTGNPTEEYGIDTIDEVSSQVWNALG